MSGDCMAVVSVKHRGKWRSQVIQADMALPPIRPEFRVLFESPWCSTRRESQQIALAEFWVLYLVQHGFKHPHDPTRTAPDTPPPKDVVVLRQAA